MIKRINNQGFSIVELLVAIAFISISTILILHITSSNNKLRRINEEDLQVLFYATEAVEATKIVDWSDLTVGGHHPVLVSDIWTLSAGSEVIDGRYTRTVTIDEVYRTNISNGNVYGDIGGVNLDADTKKITVSVDWISATGVSKQETLETYRHRWQADRWTQTDWFGGAGQSTWSDEDMFFSKDTGIDIRTPGIVSLVSGFIDWSYATTTDTFDTPGNFEDNDVFELDGYAYLVTKNNPSGDEFYVLNVADPENTSKESSLNIGGSVTSVIARGNYVYLSTHVNNAEFQIIDVSDKEYPAVIFKYDLDSNVDATDVAVDSNYAYIVQGDTMHSFDISNPTTAQYLSFIEVDDNTSKIFLSANYVYLATKDADKEMQIVSVATPTVMQLVGQYNLDGSLKGTDVAVRGSRAYLSTENSGSYPEFYIFDVSNPINPILLGEHEIGEMVHSFSIVGPYILLGTNFLNEELVVLDVSDPLVMIQVSGFNLTGYVLGMSANCSLIYAATSGNQEEFFIISTEVVNCEYADIGELESSTFDTGSDQVAYNWIAFTGTEPLDTSIRFQLATSNNSLGPWNFVGPDGTATSYYTDESGELINYTHHLNQRYMRYKLYLDSQADLEVPILEEVTISYSTFP